MKESSSAILREGKHKEAVKDRKKRELIKDKKMESNSLLNLFWSWKTYGRLLVGHNECDERREPLVGERTIPIPCSL